jgi:hypothetical protein
VTDPNASLKAIVKIVQWHDRRSHSRRAGGARPGREERRAAGFLRLFRMFLGRDFRCWLAAMTAFMVAFGRNLKRTEER